jgi:hypothetical protein
MPALALTPSTFSLPSVRQGSLTLGSLLFFVSLASPEQAISQADPKRASAPVVAQLPPVDRTVLLGIIEECDLLGKSIPPSSWGNPPARDVPPTLVPEAARLMERLLAWPGATAHPSDEDDGLYRSWSRVLESVFRIQTDVVKMDCLDNFRFLDSVLARLGPPDSAPGKDYRAKMIARLSNVTFRRWISSDPDVAVPRLLELEKNWVEPLGSPLPEWWLFIRQDYASSLYCFTAPPDPASGKTSYHELGARWCREYLSDPSTPLYGRRWLAGGLGTSLLTVGRAGDAAIMLDLAKNSPGGEELAEDPGWLRDRFWIAHTGHGDRAQARTYLDKLEALVSAGKLKPDADEYRVVLQCYNMHLNVPDAVLKQQAQEAQAESRLRYTPHQKE